VDPTPARHTWTVDTPPDTSTGSVWITGPFGMLVNRTSGRKVAESCRTTNLADATLAPGGPCEALRLSDGPRTTSRYRFCRWCDRDPEQKCKEWRLGEYLSVVSTISSSVITFLSSSLRNGKVAPRPSLMSFESIGLSTETMTSLQ